jgi:outer membrane protein assembly factor BamB
MHPASRRGAYICAAMLCAAGATPLQAQEWTRFRGPNGSGISSATTVPVEITSASYNWRVALPGRGHSSPVVWGQKIFLTSAEESTGKRHLLCINSADGREIWRKTYDFSAYPHHQFNTAASSTPVVDEGRVYVVWPTPQSVTVHAVDHAGKEVWKRDLGALPVQHGGASSPILVGEVLIVNKEPEAAPAFVTGLDRKTGVVKWQHERKSKDASYSTPLVYQPKDGPAEVIFTSNAHGFTSLDPQTGTLNWEAQGVFGPRCVGSPVLLPGGLVFGTAGNGGGQRQAVALQPGSLKSKTEPKVVYQLPARGVSYVPTPTVVGDHIFLWGDAGIVTCIKASTGESVWMERVGGNFFGSPVCVNGKLYAVSGKGELVVVEASEQFKILSRCELGEPSHATPAVSGGVMYIRTESHLLAIGGKK